MSWPDAPSIRHPVVMQLTNVVAGASSEHLPSPPPQLTDDPMVGPPPPALQLISVAGASSAKLPATSGVIQVTYTGGASSANLPPTIPVLLVTKTEAIIQNDRGYYETKKGGGTNGLWIILTCNGSLITPSAWLLRHKCSN